MTQKTPLYDWHVAHGAKMVEFGGFQMPVSYQGVLAEHEAVRKHCGLFDISHMGEIECSGPEAGDFVQYLTSNDVSILQDRDAQYSLLMSPEGYAIDDILVYRRSADRFLLCVNAANTKQDFAWIQTKVPAGVAVTDQTAGTGMFALQGPNSVELLVKLQIDLHQQERFTTREITVAGIPVLLSRTGYTGEEGCEFFFDSEYSLELWEALLQAGEGLGCQPIGLGARDTLRLEMGYVLYGHELNREINPFEAGLHWVVKLQSGEFIGRDALVKIKAQGVKRKLWGLKMEDRGIPRDGMTVCTEDGKKVGQVLSGTMSPSLKQGIATALLSVGSAELGQEIFVDIRGKMKKAKIVKLPFIQRD